MQNRQKQKFHLVTTTPSVLPARTHWKQLTHSPGLASRAQCFLAAHTWTIWGTKPNHPHTITSGPPFPQLTAKGELAYLSDAGSLQERQEVRVRGSEGGGCGVRVLSPGLGHTEHCGVQSERYFRCKAHVLLGPPTLHTTHQKHCGLRLHPPGSASLAADLGCIERFLNALLRIFFSGNDYWLEG